MSIAAVIGSAQVQLTIATLSVASSATSTRQWWGELDIYTATVGGSGQSAYRCLSFVSAANAAGVVVSPPSTVLNTGVFVSANNAAQNFDLLVLSDTNNALTYGTLSELTLEKVSVG